MLLESDVIALIVVFLVTEVLSERPRRQKRLIASTRCDFRVAEESLRNEELTTHDALFVSASGRWLVVKSKANPRMRVLATLTKEGTCYENSVIFCKEADTVECNADPTPASSVFKSMFGALKFLGSQANLEHKESSPLRVVSIGIGAGALDHWVRHNIPHVVQNTVDINEEVIKAATTYLGVPKSIVVQQDGCRYIADQPDQSLDVLFVDAFNEQDRWPPCFLTHDFMFMVKKKLVAGGIMIGDVWQNFEMQVQDAVKSASMHMKKGTCTDVGNLVYAVSNEPLKENSDANNQFGGTRVPEWFHSAAFRDVS